MLRGMGHVVRAVTAVDFALATRRDLLLEVLALDVRFDMRLLAIVATIALCAFRLAGGADADTRSALVAAVSTRTNPVMHIS